VFETILTIAVSLMFALASSVANAASFNIGVTGALAKINADGTETTGAGASGTANTNSASVENEDVPIGSVFVEYQSDYWGLTLGVEHIPGSADVSDSIKRRNDTETSVTGDDTLNSDARTFASQAEVENYNLIYIEAPTPTKKLS
jgi:hypothetical protein